MNVKNVFGAALVTAVTWLGAASAQAEEIKISVGCPPVPACADWVWAEDLAKTLREEGLEAKVFTGGALGKDPEVVDQLSQGLLQFGLTNFVMIKQVDPRILGFVTHYMFDEGQWSFCGACSCNEIAPRDALGELVEWWIGQDQVCGIEFLGIRSQRINAINRLVNTVK